MKQEIPQRIAIIGLPGSGKSTFAIKLGKTLNLPVHHLDRHQFEGKKKRDRAKYLSTKEALLKENTWVIEGCSLSTLEMRFARADTVMYFHFPRLLCYWRLCKRLFSFDKQHHETGCLDGINWTLIKYIWDFNRDKRQALIELRRQYPKVDFLVFHSSKDLDKYLENLTHFSK